MPLPLGGEHGLPYSRGLMARALIAVGVAPDRAYALARRVRRARERGRGRDGARVARHARGREPRRGRRREAVRQLRRYQQLRELELPLVILVGGATGTGKSTVATEIAYRFGITRVTSTDFVRETMRAFFSREFMPSIHHSSFEAGEAAPDADDPLITASSSSRARCSSACARRSSVRCTRVVDGARGRPSRSRAAAAARRARRRHGVRRARSRTRRHTRTLLHARGGHRAADGEVSRPLRRDPPPPGVHRRAGGARRCAGDRERERRARHPCGRRPRPVAAERVGERV